MNVTKKAIFIEFRFGNFQALKLSYFSDCQTPSTILLPKSMQSARRFIKLIGNQEVPNMMTIPMSILLVLFVLASSSSLLIADLKKYFHPE